MLLTNHALTGVVLGLSIENEVVLVPVAFASHFVLDATPHFGGSQINFKSPRWLLLGAVDFTMACSVVVVACLVWPRRIPHVLLGAFFACLPDLFYIPEIMFGWKLDGALRKFHSGIQWSETTWGLITEGVWASLMLILLHALV